MTDPRAPRRVVFLALALSLLSASCAGSRLNRPTPPNRLAVLMAAPWGDETAMHNDVVAMGDALRRRGCREDEILVLEGTLTRSRAVAFLRSAGRRIASWKTGSVLLYYTGHGSPTSFDERTAEAALQLEGALTGESDREDWMSWEEALETLAAPDGVGLVILADS